MYPPGLTDHTWSTSKPLRSATNTSSRGVTGGPEFGGYCLTRLVGDLGGLVVDRGGGVEVVLFLQPAHLEVRREGRNGYAAGRAQSVAHARQHRCVGTQVGGIVRIGQSGESEGSLAQGDRRVDTQAVEAIVADHLAGIGAVELHQVADAALFGQVACHRHESLTDVDTDHPYPLLGQFHRMAARATAHVQHRRTRRQTQCVNEEGDLLAGASA